MPAAIPIAGAVIGGIGASRQASATRDAAQMAAQAAQFNPYNISGLFGNVGFQGQQGTVTADSQQEALRGLLGNQAWANLSGSGQNANFASAFRQGAGNTIPGLFGNALNVQDPTANALAALGPYMSQLAGAGQFALGQAGPQNQALTAGLFNQFGAERMAASAPFMQANPQLNVGGNFGFSEGLFGQAANLAGQAPFDPTNLMQDRLTALRTAAAPQEEQALNSLQQRLFSQGRLGSTGGSRDFEAFGRGLGQADLGRQVEAQNLGLQAQMQSANILGQKAGMFGNLGAATGAQALQSRGQDIGIGSTNIANELARRQALSGVAQNFASPLLGAGVSLSGQDISRLGTALGAGQGLFGTAGQFAGDQFSGQFGVNEAVNARAMQRLSAAQGLFGFGQDLSNQDYNRGLSGLQGMQSIDSALRSLAALGLEGGAAGAASGGNVAQALLANTQSPTGAFLGSLGTGLFDSWLQNRGSQ